MSRIGNAPVAVPSGVEVAVDGVRVTVKGPRGSLTRSFPDLVSFTVDEGVVTVSRADDERRSKAMHGLSRALLANMVTGVSSGFRRELSLVGVGYRAAQQGNGVELQVGFSHPVKIDAVDGVELEVPEPTKIVVSGIDKELVGQVAADIRSVRPPEPYKGKGIRYSDETIRRKAGKSGVSR
ncbi:MAG: 50S ribosomal protein L6 [Acidimicrobiia bacterium]|nr:MAG: 50S ribosomal protein L6 [Acidimicrobiia bacterium]